MVTTNEYVPQRGDAVWVDFNPLAGHEQAGRRPAIVISKGAYNGKTGLAILCPITNQMKGYPFEVIIPPGLDVRGVVLSDQVRSMDWQARNAALICQLPGAIADAVLQRVGTLLAR